MILASSVVDNASAYGTVIEDYIDSHSVYVDDADGVSVGDRLYQVDFQVDASQVDEAFVNSLVYFENYSGFGFAPVTVLVKGIKVDQSNFRTMGKNSLNWKIYDELLGVSYVKFKVDKRTDELLENLDDIDLGYTSYPDKCVTINAICSFGLNIYKGVIHYQAIVKDYDVVEVSDKGMYDSDWDLDIDLV